MSRRRSAPPPLPGWGPISPPSYPRRRGGGVARWWWPAAVVVGFLALVGWVLGHDPGPSPRGLLALGLGVVVLVVLTVRHRYGPRVLAVTLAEYAIVGVLLAALVTLSTPEGSTPRPARTSTARRPPPVRVEATSPPSNPLEWIAQQWRRAGELADRQNHPAHSPTAKE
jgi:hypothetical protein